MVAKFDKRILDKGTFVSYIKNGVPRLLLVKSVSYQGIFPNQVRTIHAEDQRTYEKVLLKDKDIQYCEFVVHQRDCKFVKESKWLAPDGLSSTSVIAA